MPCTRRLKAYRGREGGIVFNARDGYYDQHLELPCGQCLDCKLRRSRDWAIRMMHESQSYDHNSFITLTYSNENLPDDRSLNMRHWQLFAKRLRKRAGSFRFFQSGEYSDPPKLRPHFHAIIFGKDFHEDRKLLKENQGFNYYSSELLTDTWGQGHCIIGDLSFDSASYVAQYITKKITGDQADDHYARIDPTTGECWSVKPEFSSQSRGGRAADGKQLGGIGRRWFDKYANEIYDHDDFAISNGRKFRPPQYYDKLLEASDSGTHNRITKARRKRAMDLSHLATPETDRNRETILTAQLKLKKGKL